MAAITTTSPSHNLWRSEDEIKDLLTSKAIEVIRAIVSDNQMRMEGYKADRNLLNAGIFYPNEYYQALKSINQQRRIDYLVQRGSFWHGFAPITHFEMIPVPPSIDNPTGFIGCGFVLKQGVLPTAALSSLRQKVTLVGCAEACQIAYYEAIKDVFGDAKFNRLFAADSSTPLKIGQSRLLKNPIGCLIRRLPSDSKTAKGQFIQITNTPLYRSKHITGGAASFITLCCENTPQRVAFTTLGLKPGGMTHTEVNETLVAEFNKLPIGMVSITPEVARRIFKGSETPPPEVEKLKSASISSLDEFAQLNGGGIVLKAEIGADRITLLANATFTEARRLLDSWAAEL